MLVPDTLQGALMLSLIDFFLSFVVIAAIGLVLAAFPWLDRMVKLSVKDPIQK
jgi:divalent metal cation (Fe/Co/Zn/Cd) transporter